MCEVIGSEEHPWLPAANALWCDLMKTLDRLEADHALALEQVAAYNEMVEGYPEMMARIAIPSNDT
jgi:hypothetical protein